jgi:hypothetical protein
MYVRTIRSQDIIRIQACWEGTAHSRFKTVGLKLSAESCMWTFNSIIFTVVIGSYIPMVNSAEIPMMCSVACKVKLILSERQPKTEPYQQLGKICLPQAECLIVTCETSICTAHYKVVVHLSGDLNSDTDCRSGSPRAPADIYCAVKMYAHLHCV